MTSRTIQVEQDTREMAPFFAPDRAANELPRQLAPRSTTRTALKILELFSADEPELGVSEMARRLGVHKSNVSRLAAALEAEGFLTRTPKGRYRLGLYVWAMGSVANHSHALYRSALVEMCEIRQQTGESTHLAVLVGLEVIPLERFHSESFMRRIAGHAHRRPAIHATSTGKVLLAYARDEIRERVIAQGLPRLTPSTLVDPDKFRAELAKVRTQGYAIDREEFSRGISSLSAPIFTDDRQSMAAISVVGTSDRLTGRRMEQALRVLLRATERISQTAR
jgi:DNA-binding IclR family transcriptional regulator